MGKEEKSLINLRDDQRSIVAPLRSAPHTFIYSRDSLTSDQSFTCQIEIPKELREHSLFKAFVAFSKDLRFLRLASGSQYHYAQTLKYLIDFFELNENQTLLSEKNDRALSVHYLNHMIKSGKSQDAVYRNFSSIKTVLNFYTDRYRSDFKIEDHDDYLDDLVAQMPDLAQPESYPKKTFLDVFDVNHTDEEILISMRHVLAWFMLTIQNIREEFLQKNSDLATELFRFFNNSKAPYQNDVMKMYGSSYSFSDLSRHNGMYQRALLRLRNPILNEIMVMGSRNIGQLVVSGKRFSIWQVRRELECQFLSPKQYRYLKDEAISDNRLCARYKSKILGKSQNYINSTVFPVGCLFTSTLSERRALAWLLASDRVQASGQDEVKMDGMLFDMFDEQDSPKQLQIKFPKGRSKRPFKTPVYERGKDALFDVFYNFYLLRKSEPEYFNHSERPDFLLPSKWNKLSQRPAAFNTSSHLPLLLLGMPGTTMHERCVAEVEKAKPFLEVLRQSVETSTRYSKERSLHKRGKIDEVRAYPKTISLDIIAQTRAVMEDSPNDDRGITSELSAHNTQTHENTYLARSDISKNPTSTYATFAADVGDKMYELARKMGSFIKEEPEYNSKRIMERLGLSAPAPLDLDGSNELNEVLNLSKETGLASILNDGVNHLSKKYIVQSPVIAAIIISHSEHLDRIQNKFEKESDDEKIKVIVSHKIYLSSLLEKFSANHIKKGREIAKLLSLPYKSRV